MVDRAAPVVTAQISEAEEKGQRCPLECGMGTEVREGWGLREDPSPLGSLGAGSGTGEGAVSTLACRPRAQEPRAPGTIRTGDVCAHTGRCLLLGDLE